MLFYIKYFNNWQNFYLIFMFCLFQSNSFWILLMFSIIPLHLFCVLNNGCDCLLEKILLLVLIVRIKLLLKSQDVEGKLHNSRLDLKLVHPSENNWVSKGFFVCFHIFCCIVQYVKYHFFLIYENLKVYLDKIFMKNSTLLSILKTIFSFGIFSKHRYVRYFVILNEFFWNLVSKYNKISFVAQTSECNIFFTVC